MTFSISWKYLFNNVINISGAFASPNDNFKNLRVPERHTKTTHNLLDFSSSFTRSTEKYFSSYNLEIIIFNVGIGKLFLLKSCRSRYILRFLFGFSIITILWTQSTRLSTGSMNLNFTNSFGVFFCKFFYFRINSA